MVLWCPLNLCDEPFVSICYWVGSGRAPGRGGGVAFASGRAFLGFGVLGWSFGGSAVVGLLCLARLLGALALKLLAVRGLGLGRAGPVEGCPPARGEVAFLPWLGVSPLVKPLDSH